MLILRIDSSFYTHSIAWALHNKEYAKDNKNKDKLLGNIIDKKIRYLNYNQTIGIPQGSRLMDLIAELILGYADKELYNKVNNIDFKILRYKDDYRIFCNDTSNLNILLKELSITLSDLNLSFNHDKTYISNDIIRDSIKKDKKYLLLNQYDKNLSLEKQLLTIYNISLLYPNSGILQKLLSDIYNNIKVKKLNYIDECISILTNILIKNPKTYEISVAILSKLLDYKNEDVENCINKILKKTEDLVNTDYLLIYLQRLSCKVNRDKEYKSRLCQKLYNLNINIWDSSFLKDDFFESSIINEKEYNKTKKTVSKGEVCIFNKKEIY